MDTNVVEGVFATADGEGPGLEIARRKAQQWAESIWGQAFGDFAQMIANA